MRLHEHIRRYWGRLTLLTIALLIGTGFIYANRERIDWESLIDYGEGIHALWFISGFLLLPLAGFPISVFLVVAGIRFGLIGGMALASVGMIFHSYAAFFIAHSSFRNPVRQFLEKRGYAIPPVKAQHRVWFTALFAALHGPPYIAKLYLLALTDIPRRTYVWIGGPVYIAFGLLPVAAGTAVAELKLEWIALLVVIVAVFTLAGFWIQRRFGGRIMEATETSTP